MEKNVQTLNEFLSFPLNSTKEIFEKFKTIESHIYNEYKGKKNRKFLYLRGRRKNKVVLVAHADTVWSKDLDCKQTLIESNGFFVGENSNFGIGADDRAGCAILWELRNSGHSLLIVDGEELGSISSKWIRDSFPEIMNELNNHQFMIEFDRRNAKDFKCYNVGTDKFRQYIQNLTGYSEPDRFSCTDITTLCRDICGVNLSVGYYNEHTNSEKINIAEWQNTLNLAKYILKKKLKKFILINDFTIKSQTNPSSR